MLPSAISEIILNKENSSIVSRKLASLVKMVSELDVGVAIVCKIVGVTVLVSVTTTLVQASLLSLRR